MGVISSELTTLLFGLEEELSTRLLVALRGALNIKVVQRTSNLSAVERSSADIVFCHSDCGIVVQLRSARPDLPIVVVSRSPETGDWIDSLAAGATEYCAAPFEPCQMRWVLESTMRRVPAVA